MMMIMVMLMIKEIQEEGVDMGKGLWLGKLISLQIEKLIKFSLCSKYEKRSK